MAEEWERAKPKSASKASSDGWERATPKADAGPVAEDVLSEEDIPLLTGLMQGATFGFSDELAARLESMMAGTDYRDNWKRRQAELERYRRLAPGQMLGGEIAGSAATMLLPLGLVGNVARAGKGISALRTLGLAAGQGALEGIGKGTRPYTDPSYGNPYATAIIPALDATKGALEGAIGLGLGKAVGGAAGLALSPLKRPVKAVYNYGLQKLAKPLFKVPEEVAKEVLENPSVWRGAAKTVEEVTKEKILPLANAVSEKASEAKKLAVNALGDTPAATPKEVTKMVLDKLKEKDVLFKDAATGKIKSTAGQKVISDLKGQISFLDNLAGEKGYLTEQELHRFYEVLKPAAQFSKNMDGASKTVADSYKRAVGAVRERLGQKNEAFDALMKKAEVDTDAVVTMKKAIGLKDALKGDARYEAVDTTFNKLRQIRKKETTQDVLKKFVEKYGDDQSVVDQLKRATNEKHFGLKAPFFVTGMGIASNNPAAATAAFIRDVFGPNLWKQAAVLPSRGGPGFMDSILRPAFVTGASSPTLSPEYTGTFGMSAEEYRARKKAAEEESRTD